MRQAINELAGAQTLVRPQAAQVELHLASRFEPGDSSLTVDYGVSNRLTGRVHSAAGHIIKSLRFTRIIEFY